MNDKPKRCIDAVLKCCERCPYGAITYDDLSGCCYDISCVFGFENDEPTPKELEEFNHYKKNKGWCFYE